MSEYSNKDELNLLEQIYNLRRQNVELRQANSLIKIEGVNS